MGMKNKPDRLWARYDAEYGVVSGSLKKFPLDLAVEYVRADLVELEITLIREDALREAADGGSKLADHAVTALAYEHAHACRDEILELIGDKHER